jgi:beta-glucanase (GH16 family)
VDWTEDWIAMYVDGNIYAKYDTQKAAVGFFTDPLFLALTACVMNRVPADNADVFPLEYVIDYVKVYGFTQ